MTQIETMQESINEFNIIRSELNDKLKGGFTKLLKEFIDNNDVDMLAWSQYAPYFNDGDSCDFTVYDLMYSPGDKTRDDNKDYFEVCEYEIGENDTPVYCVYSVCSDESVGLQNLNKSLQELESFIHNASEFLEYAFGNHVRIIVDKHGIEVEEYEHD